MSPRRRRRLIGLSAAAVLCVSTWTATRRDGRAIAAQSAPVATGRAATTRVDAAELMRVVRELASPRYEGRRTSTAGGRAARAFVRHAFADLGLQPAGDRFEQPFQFTPSIARRPPPGTAPATYDDAANVVGVVDGTASGARAIVVSAHYDHLGVQNGRMYPGADDNASGVAALLAIARHVKAHPLRHPILFAAFDAEELGLRGAKTFLASPPRPRREIALNVNLDMVSRNDRQEIYAAGTYHHPWLKPLLEDVQRRAAVKIRFGHDSPAARSGGVEDWTNQSDHGAFHEAGIPFVYFGVEDHPDYHTPGDTADRIDPVFFRNVVEMVLDAVVTFDRDLERVEPR
jgi:hypothetical protein